MFVSDDSSVKYTALSSHDAETWVATTLYYLHADTIWTSQYICCLILISYIYLIFSTLFSFKFQYISFILEAPAQIPCMPLDPPAQTLVCHWNPLHRPWVCHWNPLHRPLETAAQTTGNRCTDPGSIGNPCTDPGSAIGNPCTDNWKPLHRPRSAIGNPALIPCLSLYITVEEIVHYSRLTYLQGRNIM